MERKTIRVRKDTYQWEKLLKMGLTVVPLPFIIPASKDKKLAASTANFCAVPNMMPGFLILTLARYPLQVRARRWFSMLLFSRV